MSPRPQRGYLDFQMAARTPLFLVLTLASGAAVAQFTDPEDGALDASEFIIDKKGFLPVPVLITEPAVGYGAGLGLLFVRNSIRERKEAQQGDPQSSHVAPPDVFGFVLGATENGTKFGGGGGMFSFDDDRWRYRGGVAKAEVNLDFYGAGGRLGTAERKLGYTLDMLASSQQVLRRLGDTSSFAALRWVWFDSQASFDASRPQPVLPPASLAARSSGLGVALEYDSRDNIFTPSRGWLATVEPTFYSPAIGSDNKYEIYKARALAWTPLSDRFVLGGRVDARAARGDVPFYQLPYIELRGVPAFRYQDDNVALAEAELRWDASARWALVGFVGGARTWGAGGTKFSDSGTVVAKGAGFRYLIARRLGVYMGADIARGPEETAFYIQVGSAWR